MRQDCQSRWATIQYSIGDMTGHPQIAVGVLFAAAAAWAQPVISDRGITNSASYAMLESPGAGIAPGSIFVIFGSGLGPLSLLQATGYPLQTSLGGVSVSIGGEAAYPLYVSAAQVAAIAPSSLLPGTHPVIVTFNGVASGPRMVPVVATDLGIFARNSGGYGTAAAQTVDPANPAIQTLGLARGAPPGWPVVLYGTGFGRLDGASDDRPPGAQRVRVPVEVLIGGLSVTPDYAGRAPAFAGLDQINFNIPAGLVSGCYVPAAIRTAGRLSNTISIPVIRAGEACPHPYGLSNEALAQIDMGMPVRIADIGIERQETPTVTSELTGIAFGEVSGTILESLSARGFEQPELVQPEAGACAVDPPRTQNRTFSTRPSQGQAVFLDAGPIMRLSGPNFSLDLPQNRDLTYGGSLGGGDGSVLRSGPWTYSGQGGSVIGGFDARVELPDPLRWTNRRELIRRTEPWTIQWSGGGEGLVRVFVSVARETGGPIPELAGFVCVARAADGQFTVPLQILTQLPTGSRGGVAISGTLTQTGFTIPVRAGRLVEGTRFRFFSEANGQVLVE